MQGGGSILALSPSFNSSSTRFAEIAAKVSDEFSEQREELGLEEHQIPVSTPHHHKQVEEEEHEEEEQREEEEEVKNNETDEDEDEVENEDEFEFSFFPKDNDSTSPISADEIFYNGQIKPIYPVFNRNLLFAGGVDDDENENDNNKNQNASNLRFPLRKLLIEERDLPSSSSSEADEVDSLPAGTYCVWTPKSASPEMANKSNSTGSSKRWRFRDFLRSNSDGKETFVFLAPSPSNSKTKKDKSDKAVKSLVSKEKRNSTSEMKVVGKAKAKASGEGAASAHEIHYVRNRALKEGDRKRSYLPYRQDLVGLFANVNGVSRNLHPF